MTNTATFTSVRSNTPALYEEHTFHMKKCVSYTYNYAPMDDYIVQHWETKTQREIANDLNEYMHRVQYRCQVLKELGIISPKWIRDGRHTLKVQRRELRVQLRKIEKQLKEIGQ